MSATCSNCGYEIQMVSRRSKEYPERHNLEDCVRHLRGQIALLSQRVASLEALEIMRTDDGK